MKEIRLVHWNSPNTDATNFSGFTGLPGGGRNVSGLFQNIGDHGQWWSSTESAVNTNVGWYRYVSYNTDNATKASSSMEFGLSVRCIKD